MKTPGNSFFALKCAFFSALVVLILSLGSLALAAESPKDAPAHTPGQTMPPGHKDGMMTMSPDMMNSMSGMMTPEMTEAMRKMMTPEMTGAMHRMMQGMAVSMRQGNMMGCAMMSSMLQGAAADGMRKAGAFSERSFLSAVLARHEGDVTLAKETLEKSKDPAIKKMADAVVKDRTAEIDHILGLLKPLGGADHNVDKTLDAAMQPMPPASKDPGQDFVNAMISRESATLGLALGAVTAASNPQVTELAQTILTSQAKEIVQYKAWLADRK